MFTKDYLDHLIRLQLLDLEADGIDFLAQDTDCHEVMLFQFYKFKTPVSRLIQNKDEDIESLIARFKEDDIDPDAEYIMKQQSALLEEYDSNHPDCKDPVFHALLAGYVSLQDNIDAAMLQRSYSIIADSGIAEQGKSKDKRFDCLMAAVLYLNDYPDYREQLIQDCRKKKGLCPYCGGVYKGLFSKKCSGCGRPMK